MPQYNAFITQVRITAANVEEAVETAKHSYAEPESGAMLIVEELDRDNSTYPGNIHEFPVRVETTTYGEKR